MNRDQNIVNECCKMNARRHLFCCHQSIGRVIEKREEATRNIIGYRTNSSIRQYFLDPTLQLFSQQRDNLAVRLRMLLAFSSARLKSAAARQK